MEWHFLRVVDERTNVIKSIIAVTLHNALSPARALEKQTFPSPFHIAVIKIQGVKIRNILACIFKIICVSNIHHMKGLLGP